MIPKKDRPLTRETILVTAEEIIRRYGPAKATVVDVAHELGVSHGSIYRFFSSKFALQEAVVGEWLDSIVRSQAQEPLSGNAAEKLSTWFITFYRRKLEQSRSSPELFEAYRVLASAFPDTVRSYMVRLETQLGAIIAEGISEGVFTVQKPDETASLLFAATIKYHHPYFSVNWKDAENDPQFQSLIAFLIQGITSARSIA